MGLTTAAARDGLTISSVVGGVPGKDGPQMAFAEDQDAVGELCSGGQDEAFGEAVRSGISR